MTDPVADVIAANPNVVILRRIITLLQDPIDRAAVEHAAADLDVLWRQNRRLAQPQPDAGSGNHIEDVLTMVSDAGNAGRDAPAVFTDCTVTKSAEARNAELVAGMIALEERWDATDEPARWNAAKELAALRTHAGEGAAGE